MIGRVTIRNSNTSELRSRTRRCGTGPTRPAAPAPVLWEWASAPAIASHASIDTTDAETSRTGEHYPRCLPRMKSQAQISVRVDASTRKKPGRVAYQPHRCGRRGTNGSVTPTLPSRQIRPHSRCVLTRRSSACGKGSASATTSEPKPSARGGRSRRALSHPYMRAWLRQPGCLRPKAAVRTRVPQWRDEAEPRGRTRRVTLPPGRWQGVVG